MTLMVGCASAEMEVASGPDGGVMVETNTGGTGAVATTGGTGGSAGTGGAGGAGGAQASPDAQPAMKMDAMSMTADAQPATTTPQACVSSHEIGSSVCMDPPNSKTGKVLRKDGRACNICATYKSDGRTVEKQFVGCIPAAGAICVMTCDECK